MALATETRCFCGSKMVQSSDGLNRCDHCDSVCQNKRCRICKKLDKSLK